MPTIYEGSYEAAEGRFAIVVSRFNATFGKKLLEGAIDGLTRHGVEPDEIDVVWVPGAIEIPLTCQRLAVSGEYIAIVALGAVIRGATAHEPFYGNDGIQRIIRSLFQGSGTDLMLTRCQVTHYGGQ